MPPLVEQIVDAIRSGTKTRLAHASGLRADTRAALARHRATRQRMSTSVRATLRRRRSAAVASLRAALRPILVPPALWDLWSPHERGGRDQRLRDEVLRVIEAHPQGIAAVDLGNQLGVDWRRVVGIGRGLADHGLVEQVDHTFFPAAKASFGW